jgi:hypothetical protein
MITIAKQLKIKEFPFEIKDSEGNLIYLEYFNEFWVKSEYDSDGNKIYFETSDGFWVKREYDSKGNEIYFENSHGTVINNHLKTDVQKAIDLLTKEGLLVDGKILKN